MATGRFRIERTTTISTDRPSETIVTREQIEGVYDLSNLRQEIDRVNPHGKHPLVYNPNPSTRIVFGVYIEGEGFWFLISPGDYRRLIAS